MLQAKEIPAIALDLGASVCSVFHVSYDLHDVQFSRGASASGAKSRIISDEAGLRLQHPRLDDLRELVLQRYVRGDSANLAYALESHIYRHCKSLLRAFVISSYCTFLYSDLNNNIFCLFVCLLQINITLHCECIYT